MKYSDVRVGLKVKDRWFSDPRILNLRGAYVKEGYGIGEIVKVLKTRIHVQFSKDHTLIYDRAHLQFLEIVL